MAHYALIDSENQVRQVIVGADGHGKTDQEWEEIYSQSGLRAKKTSYNTKNGINVRGAEPLRGNFAGKGFFYHEDIDAFLPRQPYPSWVINTDTYEWEAPIPRPNDDNEYDWDEETGHWVDVPTEITE